MLAHHEMYCAPHHWHIEVVHRLALEQTQRERRLRKVPEPRRAVAVSLQGWVAASLIYVDADRSFALCTEACGSCWHTCVQAQTLCQCMSHAGRCSGQLTKGQDGFQHE